MLIIITYVSYLAISIALTVWVGHTLFQNGRVFLVDIFRGQDELADAVNRLLIVGFYLVNFGFVALSMSVSYEILLTRVAIETVATKVGTTLLTLGAMHFFNLYVFSRIRRRRALDNAPMPVFSERNTASAAS